MANIFRKKQPVRTFSKSYKNYHDYKDYLAKDFNNRCGYTDCPDFWFGGKNNFHIDHFKPWKKYPKIPSLKTDYSNLIYCCSYVNILKSNDEGNYLESCNIDYNIHFKRDTQGRILLKSTNVKAIYMHGKLKLYLKRYGVIWMLDELINKMQEVDKAINSVKNKKLKSDLQKSQSELTSIMLSYIDYLKINL